MPPTQLHITGLAPRARVRGLCYPVVPSVDVSKGGLLSISGAQPSPEAYAVVPAQADRCDRLADLVACETILAGKPGLAASEAELEYLDTTGASEGAAVYLSETPGEWTLTRPARAQIAGRIVAGHATRGRIRFFPGWRLIRDTNLVQARSLTYVTPVDGGRDVILPALSGVQYRVLGGFIAPGAGYANEGGWNLETTPGAAIIASWTGPPLGSGLMPFTNGLPDDIDGALLGTWLPAGQGVLVAQWTHVEATITASLLYTLR